MSKEAWHVGHNEVRNIIHNEIGITKEQIQNIFRVIARDEMTKLLGDEREYIRSLIRSIVKEVIKGEMIDVIKYENFPKVIGHTWHYYQDNGGDDFKNFILNVLKTEIMDELRENFDMDLVFNTKKKEDVVEDSINNITATFVIPSTGYKYKVGMEDVLNFQKLSQAIDNKLIEHDDIKIHTGFEKYVSHNREQIHQLAEIATKVFVEKQHDWVERHRIRRSSVKLTSATTIPLTKD